MTLRRQMILFIAVPTLVIYVAILGLTIMQTYRVATASRQQMMSQLAASYASRFDGMLREAARVADTTAGLMESTGPLPDEKIYQLLEHDVRQSPLVYGAAMAFEPGTVKPPGELFSPYVCRDGEGFRRVNIDASVYDWYRDPAYTWFTAPKAAGKGVWSDPYFDDGAGNILMVTYSAPFNMNGKFGGVATADVDLPRLHQTVRGDFDPGLRFFILSADGRFVSDPDESRIMRKSIFDLAKETQFAQLEPLGREMLKGKAGVVAIDGWDVPERQWVFFAPIRSTGWVFACRLPESQVMAEVRERTMSSIAATAITLLLIVLCIVGVSRVIAAPITRMKDKVVEIGQGNLDVRVDTNSRTEEIRLLGESFNRMTAELQAQVDRLATEQAARARIEHDLDIAREIQQSLLPTSKPKLPGYEVVGWSKPADQTGGDYYDWQSRADGKTLISIADVTGHGVGPALVTAVCRAYVRASFAAGREFAPLMVHLNDLLVADLPDNRFVTYVAAMLEPATHTLEMISAGHGPLFHYIAAEKRLVEYPASGMPLGIFTPAEFEPPVRIAMAPGDLVLFVTDGLFEWPQANGDRFGLPRLRELILSIADQPAEGLIQQMYATVRTFSSGTKQDDDVTAVVIKRSNV